MITIYSQKHGTEKLTYAILSINKISALYLYRILRGTDHVYFNLTGRPCFAGTTRHRSMFEISSLNLSLPNT